MKRITIFILISLLILLASCSAGMQYETHTHTRNATYDRTFDVQKAERNNICINFIDGGYTADEMNSITNFVLSDIKKITKLTKELNLNREMIIYFLDDLLDESFMDGNTLYIRKSDIVGSDAYRNLFLNAYLDIDMMWKTEGLKGYIFDTEIETDLKEFYSTEGSFEILTLLDTRFLSRWNPDESIRAAEDTAGALGKYIIDKYGIAALDETLTDKIINEWLGSIGVDRDFAFPYEPEMRELSVTMAESSNLITIGTATYRIASIWENMENSDSIEDFLNKDINGRKFIINYAAQNSDKFNMKQLESIPINYYIGEARGLPDDQINLGTYPTGHLNRAVYVYLFPEYDSHWQYGAMTNYIVLGLYGEGYHIRDFTYSLAQNVKLIEEGDFDIDDENMMLLKYYLAAGGGYLTEEEFDFSLYCDSSAYISMFVNKDWGSPWNNMPVYDFARIPEKLRMPGDELSIAQSVSFISYLEEEYGSSRILELCTIGADFEEVFNEPYGEVKMDWLNYLKTIGEN